MKALLRTSLFVIIALAFALTACGGDGGDKDKKKEEEEKPVLQFTYKDMDFKVVQASLQNQFEFSGQTFAADAGDKLLVLSMEIVTGQMTADDDNWDITVADETGRISESVVSTGSFGDNASISSFGRVFPVSEQANTLIMHIGEEMQVDLTSAITRE